MRALIIISVAALLCSCIEDDNEAFHRERKLVRVCASGHTIWEWRGEYRMAWQHGGDLAYTYKVAGPSVCQ